MWLSISQKESPMFSKGARVGCVAGALLFGSGAVNAATLTYEGNAGFFGVLSSPTLINGIILGSAALDWTSNYLEFEVAPATTATVTVDVLAGGFPNETFRIVQASLLDPESPAAPPGTVIANTSLVPGPFPASNVGQQFVLSTGVDYFLELHSDKPAIFGSADGSVSVLAGGGLGTVPLPSALVLFGSVLAGVGLFMRRRRDGGKALAV